MANGKRAEGADLFLRTLVEMVERSDSFSIGITLNVSGMLYSGMMVSTSVYLRNFAEDMAKGLAGALSDPGLEDEYRRQFLSALESPGQEEGSEPREVRVINLKNVRVYDPSGSQVQTSGPGAWWRVRLDCIGGFTLGMPG